MSAADNEHPPANEEDNEPTAAEKAQMEMRRRIMKIMMDTTLSDAEKAQKRQDLMSGKWSDEQEDKPGEQLGNKQDGVLGSTVDGACIHTFRAHQAHPSTSKSSCHAESPAHTGVRSDSNCCLQLLSPIAAKEGAKKEPAKKAAAKGGNKTDLLEDTLKCVICFNLCERPVTVRVVCAGVAVQPYPQSLLCTLIQKTARACAWIMCHSVSHDADGSAHSINHTTHH